MLVGYMRVSTAEQNLALQHGALLATGIAPERIHDDTCSGAVTNRPGLTRARAWCMKRFASDRFFRSEYVSSLIAAELPDSEIAESLASRDEGIAELGDLRLRHGGHAAVGNSFGTACDAGKGRGRS